MKESTARGPGEIFGISSVRDVRRIFLSLKFLIPGFLGRKIWQVFFFFSLGGGGVNLCRDFYGYYFN